MADEKDKDVRQASEPSAEEQNVPYARFKKVNDDKKRTETELEQAKRAIQALQQQAASSQQPAANAPATPAPVTPAANPVQFIDPDAQAMANTMQATMEKGFGQMMQYQQAREQQRQQEQLVAEAKTRYEAEVGKHLDEMPVFEGRWRDFGEKLIHLSVYSGAVDDYGNPKSTATIAAEVAAQVQELRDTTGEPASEAAPEGADVVPGGEEVEPEQPSPRQVMTEVGDDGKMKLSEDDFLATLSELTQGAPDLDI